MSEIIENPFNEMWNNFDMAKFKGVVNELLDSMLTAEPEELHDTLDELEEMVVEFTMMLWLKGSTAIEVIKVSDLPEDVREEMDLDESDETDGYIPKKVLPPDILEIIKSQKPPQKPKRSRGSDWIK